MQLKWLSVGASLLLGGCASVEMVPYTVTSFPEVPLKASDKKPAKVKFVSKVATLSSLVSGLNSEFAKHKEFQVVTEGADYWFILDGAQQYAKGVPHHKFGKTVQDRGDGGSEVISKEAINLASSAKSVSVAVYETKTLAPVHYFEISLYDGDNGAGAVKSEDKYAAAFSRDVIERIMDVFVQQKKDVETPMPTKADSDLRNLFKNRDYKGFIARYKSLSFDLKALCKALKAVESGTADDATKALTKDADAKLGNYYLYLLVKESLTMDEETLRTIYDEQLLILESTEADGIAESCPVALARLEYKLANLGE